MAASCLRCHPSPTLHESRASAAQAPTARPVLRWAGSKRSLLPQLISLLPDGGRYYEPFAGSACLFFATQWPRAVLGDRNPDLISFYRTMRHRPVAVAQRARAWDLDEQTYYAVRRLEPRDLDAVSRAARFLYLNRLCFNGVYRTNRRGEFNVPFGSRSGEIPSASELSACAAALRACELRCGDFSQTVRDAEPGDVVYLDPPYTETPERAYGVYGYGSFDLRDLDRMLDLLESLDDRGVRFLFSYAALGSLTERARPQWIARRVDVAGRLAANMSSRIPRREILLSNVPVAR